MASALSSSWAFSRITSRPAGAPSSSSTGSTGTLGSTPWPWIAVPFGDEYFAAILALIGKPWSKRELLGALEASDDQEKTADSRAALLETGDEECEKAVLAWE